MPSFSIDDGQMAFAKMRTDNLDAAGTPQTVRALVRGVVAATNPRGYLQAARCTDAVDVVEDFGPRIACPTLCITGDADTVNPMVVGRAVAASIPKARFVAPEEVGHLAEIEAPIRTLGLLKDFFFREQP